MKTSLLYFLKNPDLASQDSNLDFEKTFRFKVAHSRLNRNGPNLDEKIQIVKEGQSTDKDVNQFCEDKGISVESFMRWSRELLLEDECNDSFDSEVAGRNGEYYKIVSEVLSGKSSVAEVCRREQLDHAKFLNWSRAYMQSHQVDAIQKNVTSSINGQNLDKLRKLISSDVLRFFESYVNFKTDQASICIDKDFEIETSSCNESRKLICLYRMNDIRRINKHYEKLNLQMRKGDVLIGCLETIKAHRKRLFINRLPIINELYFGFEFILNRMLPKIELTKQIYFNITKGKGRHLSKAEGLGRLVSCGFKIMDHISIDGLLYFVVQKEKEPSYDLNPSYGPIYAMPRLGKNGKIIRVFKMRTMHPYSEYLQDYIVRGNGYSDSGKPANDFRIPLWGKIMRRYWMDEIPQLLNVLRGELKLVGVRPVSERYFQDIPKEMQKLRLTQKPGCIPPYVALNRDGNVMSVLTSEMEYLKEKSNNPYTTDLKYFFSALWNIVFRQRRSA